MSVSSSSSSSMYGMRSVESLQSIPTTASLNNLINRTMQRPVADDQEDEEEEEEEEEDDVSFFPVHQMKGRWNNLTSSSSSSYLFNQLYSSRKNSNNNKSCEVLPPINCKPSSTSIPQVQFFLSQKQKLQLEQQSIQLPSPNLAATNNNPLTNQGNNNRNNSYTAKMKSPLSSPTRSHPSTAPSSSSTSSSSFSPLTKCKSQISLVRPVLISNGPSYNSGGHQNMQRSSSSANLAAGNSSKNVAMVRSLPLKTAPVKPTIPSQRVQPQTSHQVPSLKTAAVVFPTEQHHPRKSTFQQSVPLKPLDNSRQYVVPETRYYPAELDFDEFLPNHIQNTVRLGISQPEMPEPEAMNNMIRGHGSVITALAHRKKNIQIVLAVWSSKNPMKAIDQAIQLEDNSVLVDILNVINLKPSFWTLDLCQILLPPIQELLQSKYESYMSVGCTSLKLILKNFSTMITSNITAPPGIGVDISREERYNKCMTCYKYLLSVRAFLLKRQTMQGKSGRSFRELSILMQSLE